LVLFVTFVIFVDLVAAAVGRRGGSSRCPGLL